MQDDTLPIHPFTGLRAVGVLPSGRVVWPIKGAEDNGGDAAGSDQGGNGGDQGAGDGKPSSGESAAGATGAGKTFTQADLDRIVSERVARERSKYGDYEALKTKAGKFDEIEEANKSELERANAKAEAAERRAAELERQGWQRDAAEAAKLPASMAARLTGSTLEEMQADAKALAESLKGVNPGPGDAGQGTRTNSGPSLDEQIAAATKAGNHRLAIALKRQKTYADQQT